MDISEWAQTVKIFGSHVTAYQMAFTAEGTLNNKVMCSKSKWHALSVTLFPKLS